MIKLGAAKLDFFSERFLGFVTDGTASSAEYIVTKIEKNKQNKQNKQIPTL